MRNAVSALPGAAALTLVCACAVPATIKDAPATDAVSSSAASTAAGVREPDTERKELPGVTGELLSIAEEELEEAGFEIDVRPVDGHLIAVNYANWRVVGQAPRAGSVATGDTVTLEVKKTAEAESSWCGDNDC